MVRNKPSGDAFESKRRSPALGRRQRDAAAAAGAPIDVKGGSPSASPERRSHSSSPRSSSPRNQGSGGASPRSGSTSPSTSRSCDQGTTGPAEVSVEKKDGFFEIKGNMSMAVDADITYGILTDYEKNPEIFKTVSKVEVEYRDQSKFVTQHAHWNLLFWSGTFDMKMKVVEDRPNRAVSFKLNEPGFLKLFNGHWGIEPRMVNGKSAGCNVVVTQEVLPSLLPPGPLASYLSRILGNQVKAVLEDLSVEAERVQMVKRISAK